MSSLPVPQPEIEQVQHPILGALKFPKDMAYDQRNQIISDMEKERNLAGPDNPTGTYDFGDLGKVTGVKVNGRPATRQEAAQMLAKQRDLGAELGGNLQRKQQDISNYVQGATSTDQQTKEYMGDLATMAVAGGASQMANAGRWGGSVLPNQLAANLRSNTPSLAKRFVLGNTVGRIPGASLLGESFERPTAKDIIEAIRTPNIPPPPSPTLFQQQANPTVFQQYGQQSHLPVTGPAPTPMSGPSILTPMDAALQREAGTAAKPSLSPTVGNTADTQQLPSALSPSVPSTPSGEAVLNQALTSLDNKSLLKVARSRGIDVSAEAQLKPGVANSRLVRKIINDFSTDELEEARNQGLELSRNIPVGSTTTPEAYQYKVLQTFFPDVSIPKALQARAQAAIAQRPAAATGDNIVDLLQKSIAMAKKK